MKRMLAMLIVLVLIVACADKAAELYDTAQFEELQNNKEHAVQLYRAIIKNYPNSAEAKKAANRLAELEKEPH